MSTRKVILPVLALVMASLVACGDDDSSFTGKGNDKPEFSSPEDDVFDSEEYLDSTAIGDAFYSEMGSATIVKGEVDDYRRDMVYKTIQFGPYVWMAENAYDDIHSSYGLCYDRDSLKCEKYGKLYLEEEASSLCPPGFDLPSEEDFRYMIRFAGSLRNPNFGFNLQMGGSCAEDGDKLSCSNAGQAATLVTGDYSYIRVKKNSDVFFGKAKPGHYYSVRCMKYTYFVEKKILLPNCDSSSYYGEDFFVASEGSNFRCKNGKWTNTSESYCPNSENGQRYYYGDILYVCDGSWKKASMNDMDEKCTSENEWTVRKLNGKNYICEDEEWRLPTSLEDNIGLCTPENVGKIDSVVKTDTLSYYCGDDGWRTATLTDFVGECDSTIYFKVVQHRGTRYTCRTSNLWKTLDWKEDSLGICSPRINGKIDTIKLESDTTLYYCDSIAWRKATVADLYGVCDSSRYYKEVSYMGTPYTCRTSGRWESLTSLETEIGVCTPKRFGKIDTAASKVDYCCDSTGWRSTVAEDYFGECTEQKKYTTVYFKGSDYGCENGPKWTLLKYPESDLGYCIPSIKGEIRIDSKAKDYICDSVWRAATIDEVLGTCTADRDAEKKIFGTTKYVCAFGAWRKATKLDDSLGVCAKATLKKMDKYNSTDYICMESGWTTPTLIAVHDSCTAERENEVVEFNGEKYGCRSKKWNRLTGIAAKAGYCTPDREGEFYLDHDEYGYKCESGSWNSAAVWQIYGSCDNYGELMDIQGVTFFCSRYWGEWKRYTVMEETYGECDTKARGKIVTHNGKKYGCSPGIWREVTAIDDALGFCDGSGFTWKVYNGVDYVCGNSNRKWTNSSEWAMFGACDWRFEWKFGLTVGYEGQHYYCDTTLSDIKTKSSSLSGWHEISAMDSLGGICNATLKGDTLTCNNQYYYCGLINEKYTWIAATSAEDYLGKCDASRAGKKAVFEGWNVECSDGIWRRDSDDYGTFTDSRDGNQYKSIQIGSQVWMAENLRYETSGTWCGGSYNGCSTYGRLYNWATAMGLPSSANTTLVDMKDSASLQGLCPTGWRIPLGSDWSELNANCKMAQASGVTQYYDICGFRDVDAGYINIFYRNGIDYTEELDLRHSGYWKMAQMDDTTAVTMGGGVYARKKFGFSVRCIKK